MENDQMFWFGLLNDISTTYGLFIAKKFDCSHAVVKIRKKIGTHPSANVSAYVLHARSVSLTRKNMAALSELLLQMVTYLHASSRVKPRRVKTHMQIRAGWKGHKNDERWVFCFAFVTVFCFGQELIRGEMEFSLKRQGEENYWIPKGRFWLLRDATTLFGTHFLIYSWIAFICLW